jgi:hypothetical protein
MEAGVQQHQGNHQDEESHPGGPRFDPPVYIQRYAKTAEYFSLVPGNDRPLKVVDFGCSEMKFVAYAKAVERVGEMVCVDVDEEHLRRFKALAGPQDQDFVRPRALPLKVRVVCGSVTDWDDVLAGADVVTAIELIEHLHLDVLEKFPEAVFGRVRPQLAVITTPNSDFNCLFPNFNEKR